MCRAAIGCTRSLMRRTLLGRRVSALHLFQVVPASAILDKPYAGGCKPI